MAKLTINGYLIIFNSYLTNYQRVKHHEIGWKKPPWSYDFPMVFLWFSETSKPLRHLQQGLKVGLCHQGVWMLLPQNLAKTWRFYSWGLPFVTKELMYIYIYIYTYIYIYKEHKVTSWLYISKNIMNLYPISCVWDRWHKPLLQNSWFYTPYNPILGSSNVAGINQDF